MRASSDRIFGWVFYDGGCPLCLNAVARFAPMLRRHDLDLAPLQALWVQQRLGLKPNDPLDEMKLLADDGQIYGGADALLQIVRRIWWAWPLFVLAQVPGLMILFRALYERIAANRHCSKGACSVQKPLARRQVVRAFLEMP